MYVVVSKLACLNEILRTHIQLIYAYLLIRLPRETVIRIINTFIWGTFT